MNQNILASELLDGRSGHEAEQLHLARLYREATGETSDFRTAGSKKAAVPKNGGSDSLNYLNYSRVEKCLMVRTI